jgi:hypothetical protein
MRANTEADFWAKGKLDEKTGCINWQGSKSKQGYGFYSLLQRTIKAHRYAWALTHNVEYKDMTRSMVIMHLCDNPSCFNPAHLSLGSHKDNIQDMLAKGRRGKRAEKTHCIRGHEFTTGNTLKSGPHRGCKKCAELRSAGEIIKIVNRPLKTHCMKGHALTADNIRNGDIKNTCRTCYNARARAFKAKKRAANLAV